PCNPEMQKIPAIWRNAASKLVVLVQKALRGSCQHDALASRSEQMVVAAFFSHARSESKSEQPERHASSRHSSKACILGPHPVEAPPFDTRLTQPDTLTTALRLAKSTIAP